MSAGLYPARVVAEFLGKKPSEIPAMIEEDELPVIQVPAKTRSTPKVALLGLHRWLGKRSKNGALTVEELERELDRCAAALTGSARTRTCASGKDGEAAC